MRDNDEVLGREMAKPGDMLRGSAVGTVAELKAQSGRIWASSAARRWCKACAPQP